MGAVGCGQAVEGDRRMTTRSLEREIMAHIRTLQGLSKSMGMSGVWYDVFEILSIR